MHGVPEQEKSGRKELRALATTHAPDVAGLESNLEYRRQQRAGTRGTKVAPQLPEKRSGRIAMVGSRSLTDEELLICRHMGAYVASAGFTVVTGGQFGADMTYAQGAVEAGFPDRIEHVLPWARYNSNVLVERFPDARIRAYDPKTDLQWASYVRQTHPVWDQLSQAAMAFHARNVGIVIGREEDNSEMVDMIMAFPGANYQGGTMQAFRLARFFDIPIVDLRASSGGSNV